MKVFGVGTLELVMILVIGILVVGPVDMVRFARKAGAALGQLRRSELWQTIMGSRRAMNRVGHELMGEAETDLDAVRRELSQVDFMQGADPNLMKDFPGAKKRPDAKPGVQNNDPSLPAATERASETGQKGKTEKAA